MIIHSKHTGRDVTDSVPFVVSRLGVRPESEDTFSTEGLRGRLVDRWDRVHMMFDGQFRSAHVLGSNRYTEYSKKTLLLNSNNITFRRMLYDFIFASSRCGTSFKFDVQNSARLLFFDRTDTE